MWSTEKVKEGLWGGVKEDRERMQLSDHSAMNYVVPSPSRNYTIPRRDRIVPGGTEQDLSNRGVKYRPYRVPFQHDWITQ